MTGAFVSRCRLGAATVLLIARTGWAQSPCPDGRPLSGDIGISTFICRGRSCAVSQQDSLGYFHDFSIEPSVRMARAGTGATGLRTGDVIIAVDGAPITTQRGGRRLAQIGIGERIEFEVRRNGVRLRVSETAATGCNAPGLTVEARE